MEICPRCKRRCLDPFNHGESGIYNSKHIICVQCFHDEDQEIENKGTNDLPDTLNTYGPSNESYINSIIERRSY